MVRGNRTSWSLSRASPTMSGSSAIGEPCPGASACPAPRRAKRVPVPGADSRTRPPGRQRTRCAGPGWVPLARRMTSPLVGGTYWLQRVEAFSAMDGSLALKSYLPDQLDFHAIGHLLAFNGGADPGVA